MFIVTMPTTFRLGDRAPVLINGAPATVHWRDRHTLVINDTDPRAIVMRDEGMDGAGRLAQTFTCSDAFASDVERTIEETERRR